ncbi:MAG TPA: fibronectin type III domain-containing protein [Kofleriaceae bacterium]|nr:fibronectin type III domain-containing protein [Kofleriaceae bacterium]
MAVFRRGLVPLALMPLWLPWVLPLVSMSDARADQAPGMCRVVDVDFTPGGFPATSRDPEIVPQIVAWLERADGGVFDDDHQHLKTMYITNQTGRFGLGNRPGRFDFNSGPNWPYGRRVTVFPVWANRHGLTFPQVSYQNGEDFNLSHPAGDSSPEPHFCRPLMATEPSWDAASCPSAIYTDKGVFASGTNAALYPPRADLIPSPKPQGQDSPSVSDYKNRNPFDAVSQASPRLGAETTVSWPIPHDLPTGNYVVFVEVALERDFNDTYSADRYPSPGANEIPWSEYGVTYRGQPSVVYKVPVVIGDVETIATTDSYAGYGDPGPDLALNGKTPGYFTPSGTLNPPDSTITSDRPNSGAGRLLITSKDGKTFRVRVDARPEPDLIAPSAPGSMAVVDTQSGGATLSFTAPGNDGTVGTVAGYEVRYRVGNTPITPADFDGANEAMFTGRVVTAGQTQSLVVGNLLPETPYTFAVRAFDNCRNTSDITTVAFTTSPRKLGEVDACFVATAAYGSVLANDVEMLRRFRDRMLRRSVLGELAVETYYTFGPTVAGVIGESDLLRSTARGVLAPLVRWVRQVH